MAFDIANFEFAKGFKIKFKVYGHDKYIETPVVNNESSINFNFTHIFNYKTLTPDHLKHFDSGSITYMIYAAQKDNPLKASLMGLSTRVCFFYSFLFLCGK